MLNDMQAVLSGEDYTLFYCISIAINTVLDSNDKIIVPNLHRTLGKEVWNKCVLLLTFSDYARLELDEEEEYIKHIKGHAHEFQELLRSIGADRPIIKTVFDHENSGREEIQNEIIAIPVNKKPKKSKKILPGILKENQLWTDIVFEELMNKTSEENHEPLVLIRYAEHVREWAKYGVQGGAIWSYRRTYWSCYWSYSRRTYWNCCWSYSHFSFWWDYWSSKKNETFVVAKQLLHHYPI